MSDERRKTRTFRMIMGTLAVVAVVSGGAAYAATQDDSPQARSQAIVDDAAGTLGVAPDKLSDALKKALEKQVDAQVTAGKLSQERADAIKKAIEDGTRPIFGGRGFGGFEKHFGHRGHGGPGFGFAGPGIAAGVEEIATYLGSQAGRVAHAAALGQDARRDRNRAGQDRGRPQGRDHHRGDEAARRGGHRRQADEGAGGEAARRARRAPRRRRQRHAAGSAAASAGTAAA